MKRTVFFIRVSLLASLLGVAPVVLSQSSPPASERADQTKALVNKAAALIESKGKAAFSEFRVKGSEWFHADTYVFAYDLQANVLLNPAFPTREGTNVAGQKDANGKLVHAAIIRVAKTERSGWVDYMFPRPSETQPSQKWAYVKAVNIDGVPALVASAYPE
jgi:signal transduction histidine kinase